MTLERIRRMFWFRIERHWAERFTKEGHLVDWECTWKLLSCLWSMWTSTLSVHEAPLNSIEIPCQPKLFLSDHFPSFIFLATLPSFVSVSLTPKASTGNTACDQHQSIVQYCWIVRFFFFRRKQSKLKWSKGKEAKGQLVRHRFGYVWLWLRAWLRLAHKLTGFLRLTGRERHSCTATKWHQHLRGASTNVKG